MEINKNNHDGIFFIKQKLPIRIQCINGFLIQNHVKSLLAAKRRLSFYNSNSTKLLPSPNLYHSLMLCCVTRSQRTGECETLRRPTILADEKSAQLQKPTLRAIVRSFYMKSLIQVFIFPDALLSSHCSCDMMKLIIFGMKTQSITKIE